MTAGADPARELVENIREGWLQNGGYRRAADYGIENSPVGLSCFTKCPFDLCFIQEIVVVGTSSHGSQASNDGA